MKTLYYAFLINQTYKVNSFIYKLRHFPVIKHVIPQKTYAQEWFKKIIQVIVLLFKIVGSFLTKILYFYLMVFLPSSLFENQAVAFMNFFILFTIIGALINTKLLQASTKKYYAVNLMGMDAREYTISHFVFYLIQTFFTYTLALVSFFLLLKISLIHLFESLLFVLLMKIIGEVVDLKLYLKNDKVMSNSLVYNIVIALIGIGAAILLSNLKVTILQDYLWVTLPILFVLAAMSLSYLWSFSKYKLLYRKLMTVNKIIFNADQAAQVSRDNQFKIQGKDIALNDKIEKKNGYDYFNAVFFQRHQRLLLRSAYKTTFLIAVIGFVVAFLCATKVDASQNIHDFIMMHLPYFVFIMYIINRGSVITQAMFFNCDHSMLTYRFYRDKHVILNVFKTRLKTLVLINLMPAFVLAIVLLVLLFLTGGASIPIYFGLFFSVLFMSMFFSVHHLIIYYLLQPFDIHMTSKSGAYSVANFVTYIFCYFCISLELPTTYFSIGIIIATLLYIGIALYLVYTYAPKTFRLK